MIPKRIKDNLVIIGSDHQSNIYFMANQEDFEKTYEIWGLNNVFSLIAHPTRWFEIHRIWKEPDPQNKNKFIWKRRDKPEQYLRGEPVPIEKYLKKLDSLNVPVYMHEKNPIVKKSEEFPFKECLDAFSVHFYTCTFAWQIALAILMGFRRIEFYGVELNDYWENQYQKHCVCFWIGMAIGKGIDVRTSLESRLLRGSFLYGFERQNYYERR